MTKRLNFLVQKNAGIEALVAVEAWLAKSFDPKLLDLVKVRVSQMNGCAYCCTCTGRRRSNMAKRRTGCSS